ncbi:ArsR/SmtB family transcription factor [Maricaulis maris]|uniref:ArsR/SmtB family transcription factor n=1 Tax=Maricaulis maris TaxID=74318 RepID=UPI003B8D6B46
MNDSAHLDSVFSALAHPVRRQLIERLAEADATVNELAEPFAMSLPAISKHLRVLEAAGLITRGRRAQFRPCQLNAEPLEAAASWTSQYGRIWQARFDTMAGMISAVEERNSNDE